MPARMVAVNRILEREQLAPHVFRIRVEAPLIAEERRPGQFVILQIDSEFGERIPLTIADADPEEGSITLIFQAVGKSTQQLAALNVGGKIANLLGPLGRPTEIKSFGRVIAVGGGIGVAPMFPIVQALKREGNRITTIIGARTRELVILESEMRSVSEELIVCTDDGSYGRKAVVTEPLAELCRSERLPDLVVAIGPAIMMKFCVETVRHHDIPVMVSLNTIMVDGTGMCGGCRVTVDGETKFVCVDGPEFDGRLVDFNNMLKRLEAYRDQEERRLHECRIEEVRE